MTDYDEAWRGSQAPPASLAIPDTAVHKFSERTGDSRPPEAIRENIREIVDAAWSQRVALTEKFGHRGYGIPFTTSPINTTCWLILNPDRLTHHEYVVASVYYDHQFKARQDGQFFMDARLNKMPKDKLEEKLVQLRGHEAENLLYRVECVGEETREFATLVATLEHLVKLAAKGKTEKDWCVLKKVRAIVTVEE